MSWRSEHIWIEPIAGSRKLSNFCWALIVFLGSSGFLLVGTSSYLGRNLISFVPSQQSFFSTRARDVFLRDRGSLYYFLFVVHNFLECRLWLCSIRLKGRNGVYFSLGISWKKSSHIPPIPYKRYSIRSNRSYRGCLCSSCPLYGNQRPGGYSVDPYCCEFDSTRNCTKGRGIGLFLARTN
uniref:Photosystem I assembly protein Ycf4 n=1 Tax=Teucrium mascatense TaxID=2172029 RepID=A0A4Y6I4F5_9LAMI|nr:photosystem I assembly proteinYcf4 [Teucrium mascatense]QDF64456.1 photosystem I assembly proteinYcf4 [Teucrium mascatense]